MGRRKIVITYVIIVLFIVIGIGYAYLEEDLSLQNNVTLTNYSAKQPVCIKATTLHTETCSRDVMQQGIIQEGVKEQLL